MSSGAFPAAPEVFRAILLTMIGRVVGSYEILERIGEGGMGTVHRAVDRMLEREVALKAIRPDLMAQSQILERFRSEARALARLSHPNVATHLQLLPRGRGVLPGVNSRGRRAVRLQDAAVAPFWRKA